ncbi:MAG: signal peptidase I [Caulobacteraceae bacterium]
MRVKSRTHGLFELIQTIAFALVVAMVPKIVFCQPFTIPSGSMEPTLLVGDYILVSKYAYGWSRHSLPLSLPLPQGRILAHAPKRGDIVVFKEPRDGRTDIIKRLIGLPGDHIQVVGGVLQINGRAVPRQKLGLSSEDGAFGAFAVTRYRETLPNGRRYQVNSYGANTPAGDTGVYVVPAGCYFLLGDNRDNSADSRFDPGKTAPGQSACPWNPVLDRYLPAQEGAGFVPFEDLVGRADMVLLSWKPGASLLKPWTVPTGLRWDRSFHAINARAS